MCLWGNARPDDRATWLRGSGLRVSAWHCHGVGGADSWALRTQRTQKEAVALMKVTKALRHAKLRAEVGMVYVSHPTGISIEDLQKDPRFSSVAVRTLERWSKIDQWVERRMNFIEEWKTEARKRLAGQLAQARLDELQTLDEIALSGLQKIREDTVAPKSYEGLMRATVEALKYKDELRQRIGETVIEEAAKDAAGLPKEMPKDMSEEAAAAAARAALIARRQRVLPPSAATVDVVQQDNAFGDVSTETGDLPPEDSELGDQGI